MKDQFGVELTKVEVQDLERTKLDAEYYSQFIPEPRAKDSKLPGIKGNKHQAKATPSNIPLTELEYRDLAKLFTKALPLDGEDFSNQVETNLAIIKSLPRESKLALRMAYIFGSKAPREEREDLFQDLALALLKAKQSDERLAYAIARCDWLDWWRKYKIRQHTSLDSVVDDGEGSATTLGELLVGEVEFENKINSKMDAELLWSRIPADIKPLILKRLEGKPLTTRYERQAIPQPLDGSKHRKEYKRYCQRGRPKTDSALTDCERQRFNRWLKCDGYKLALSQ